MRYTLFFLWCQFICISCVVFARPDRSYKSHLSPSWYPSKKPELQAMLQKMHKVAQEKYHADLKDSDIRAVICPHAGYDYSGVVATSVYQLLKQRYFSRVILLAPSHFLDFKGVALPGKEFIKFKNVLGDISFDTSIFKSLVQNPLFSYYHQAYEIEHALEVQIPFIQEYIGKGCLLVPLLVGDITLSDAQVIAKTLKEFVDSDTLVIVSSDFVHYGNGFGYEPFVQNITDQIYNLDLKLVEQIQNQSVQGFDKVLEKTGATVCGKNPIKVLLSMIEQGAFGKVDSYVVGYDTSASDQKNPEHSVSYVGMVFSNQLISLSQKAGLSLNAWKKP